MQTTKLVSGANCSVPSEKLHIEVILSPSQISGMEVDVSAFVLATTGKVSSDEDMVFYGQPCPGNNSVAFLSNNSGCAEFTVDLPMQLASTEKIAFAATIHENSTNFGEFNSLQIIVKNSAGSEVLQAVFLCNGMTESALILGELYLRQGQWKFRAVGQGFAGGLKPLAEHFGVNIDDAPPTTTTPPPETSNNDFFSQPVGTPKVNRAEFTPQPASAPKAKNTEFLSQPAPTHSMHSLNIADVQKETIRLLSDTQKALNDVISSSYIVDGNESDQKQTLEKGFITQQQEILKNEAQKAENLEMVVAVVGTMKAGKSTSINAIVGQEVLPNRALPMTALPTLVTHALGQIEPVLYFNHTRPLIELSHKLLNELGNINTSVGNNRYPFLGSEAGVNLSTKLKHNNGFNFQEKYKGQLEIFDFLHELNDLMRMAKELKVEPPYAEYQSVDNLPRIEVEFYHLKHSNEGYGRLSILDTPGPNEFGQSDALKKVFQMQLRQASAVLLVMDYTQLNSESDGALRQEVDSIKEDLGDRLFVLVNKFDNASKNTMNKEQTRSYVATNLLGDVPEDKVFPVSSWLGYLANRALGELERNGGIDPLSDWVADFGGRAFGKRWEKFIEDPEEVREASEELWEDSNFQSPLDKVIKEAHAKAAFEALGSSLDKISNLVGELDKGAKGRISGLETDIDTLKSIVVGIENDVNSLDVLEDKFERNIKAEIDLVNEKVMEKTEASINYAINDLQTAFSIGKDSELERAQRAHDKHNHKSNNSLLQSLVSGALGFSSSHDAQKHSAEDVENSELSDITANDDGVISFSEQKAATEFLKKIEDLLKSVIKGIDSETDKIIKDRIAKLQKNIDYLMDKNVNKVIQKAQEKLNDNGVEVVFRLPIFAIKDTSQVSYQSFIEHVENKSEIRVGSRVKSGFWAGFKNVFNDDWGREEYDYKVDLFEVSLEQIRRQSTEMLNGHADKVKQSQSDFLAKDLNGQIKEHIATIQNYLDRYRGDLIQGLNDQKKDNDKKEQQKMELNGLIPRLSQCIEDADDQAIMLGRIKNDSLTASYSVTSARKEPAIV